MNSLMNMPCLVGATGNTNVGNCNQNLGKAVGYAFVPKGTKYTVTEITNMIATMNVALHADNAIARAQIVTGFKGVEFANVEATNFTFGDGTETKIRDERVGRTYQMRGLCLSDALGGLDGKEGTYEVFPIFDDNVWAGVRTILADGDEGVKGYALSKIETSAYGEASNDAPGMFTFTLTHANAAEWKLNRVAFRPVDGDINSLEGVQTIFLTRLPNTPQVAGTYQIEAAISCGSTNISTIFGTELLDESLWIVKNQLGDIVAVDGVTLNGNGNFVVALDTTDANYTAGTRFTLTLAAVSVLATAGMEWYEGTRVSFPK